MALSRRRFIYIGLGFCSFVGLQILSGKSKNIYTADESINKLNLTDHQWKERLPENAYYVLRKGKTESRRSSPLNQEWRMGVYKCIACDLELFTSDMKYESNTGWPSFTDHIRGHLETYTDLYAVPPQRGYRCARCGGHHGHVFSDGPLPRGERWCNNGVTLKFLPDGDTQAG